MCSYRKRLETFERVCWQNKGHVTDKNLALSGFYKLRTRNDDSVICYNCGLILRNWKSADVPDKEHERLLNLRVCLHLESVADVRPTGYDEVDKSGEASS